MQGSLILVGLALAGALIYFGSLQLHPWAKCPKCKGSATHRGALFSYAARACTKCAGTGRQLRWGRRFFGIGPPK